MLHHLSFSGSQAKRDADGARHVRESFSHWLPLPGAMCFPGLRVFAPNSLTGGRSSYVGGGSRTCSRGYSAVNEFDNFDIGTAQAFTLVSAVSPQRFIPFRTSLIHAFTFLVVYLKSSFIHPSLLHITV